MNTQNLVDFVDEVDRTFGTPNNEISTVIRDLMEENHMLKLKNGMYHRELVKLIAYAKSEAQRHADRAEWLH